MSLLRYAQAEKANIAKARADSIRQASMVAAIFKRDAVVQADAIADAAVSDRAMIVDPPTLATDPGEPGEIAFDTGFLYLCVATDTWLRCAIATW